jgi:myosin protein heavy chain
MPKATDVTFTEKLHSLWDGKTTKYKRSLLSQGFILTHYAADVEYDTTDWLQKNKDPLNDNVTRLLANSSYPYIASLFSDYSEDSSELAGAPRSRVKKGLFRTVAQRHKEQLSSLMSQLNQTHPHFVRCIIPNHQKRPRTLQAPLVLDQLRCNGVLEGIRIARTGFPNRLSFTEFRQRYEVLSDKMPKSYLDGQKASQMLLEHIDLDPVQYRVGISKVFFRSGILAELEERRDALVREIITRFQSHVRGYLQRRIAKKLLYRSDASLIIQRTFRLFLQLKEDPWWQLHQSMKPLLGTTQSSSAVKKRDELIQQLEIQMQTEIQTRQRLEEERRKTDSDLQRVQKTLESERALALDKEEIFIRLQQREADLTEKLAGALDDQDALEDQIDELMIAKRKAEDQSEAWRKELEQAGELIAKLEEEKNDLMSRLDSVERQLAAAETARTMRTDAEDKLEQEIELLRSRLQLEERKVQKLQNSLAESDNKLDEHLSQTNLNLQQGQQQIKNLVDENRELRNQLTALSSTSTSFEDLVRRKESELNMLHSDLKKGELERKVLEDERRKLTEKHDEVFGRLRGMQSELEFLRSEKHRLEKAAADANRLLESKISDEMESGKGRQLLDKQIRELKTELLAVQEELNQERQSRNEIAMNNENQYNQLKRENESLQMMKEAMEKDLMIDRENLRHALQNRSKVEQQKRQLEQEQKALKERVAEAEIARAKAQEEIERAMSRQVQEKEQRMEKDLRAKEDALAQADSERKRLATENARLTRAVDESEFQRQNWENTRRRIEQDTAQLKNRLLASENDNRALQNTVQQKNLEVSKANAKASETYRNKIVGLTAEKTKAEGENVQLRKQLEDAQIQIRSLEKQKEKLTLNLEDLNHEVSREHKTTRGAEKTASQLQLQLAEANRNLEMERQLKTQAQANAKQIQSTLATTNSELEECHHQLLVLQKVFDPEGQQPPTWESGRRSITHSVDLAMKLEEANQALRVSDERLARAEKELTDLRKRHQDELQEMDSMHSSSKRALLEEFNQNGQPADKPFREPLKNNFSNHSIPTRRNFTNASDDALDSNFSDKTDSLAFRKRVDLASELEEVQNQLHVSEMRNKHLQAKIDSANEKAVRFDEHNDARRAIKLEKENNRLHDLLDDSSRKNSALEASMQSIELSLKDIQAKTHEELYDYISQQDVARKNLVNVHHEALNDLAWAKEQFERLKAAKATLEIDLRQTQIELDESLAIQQQDKVSRAQLLNEFADLQIRLDAESSKVADLQASMNLYKARSEEYFSKLEQAEISVLKATRSEAFTRSQAREAEEHTAAVMAERKKMESLVEDLQRQNQHYEEKIEDLSADLNMALQAKKRLHNELEDYRSRRAADLEDKESSMEQTRKKYQSELSTLTGELEIEREGLVQSRAENRRLREEVEDLRAKWDDEVLNSSTWAKEKSRLEIKLQDITQSHDESMLAHNELQSRVVTLLAQVRSLRANIDEVTSDRDLLQKEKRSLEQRLAEAGQRLEDLANGESPAMRNAAQMDREILDIKGALARQEDIANTALERMKKSDALAEQSSRDIAAERENNVQLHKEKAQLEKQVKDLQLKLVDLETKSYSSTSHDIRFLNARVQEVRSID